MDLGGRIQHHQRRRQLRHHQYHRHPYPRCTFGRNAATDASGNFWLFGGNGYDSAGNPGAQRRLGVPGFGQQWIWISGSQRNGAAGVYGSLGMGAIAIRPEHARLARHGSMRPATSGSSVVMARTAPGPRARSTTCGNSLPE